MYVKRIKLFLFLVACTLPNMGFGQHDNEKVSLNSIARVYQEEVESENDVMDSYKKLTFEKRNDLNFGLSNKRHWLNFEITNEENFQVTYYLGLTSVMNDTLILYSIKNGTVASSMSIGEAIPFVSRPFKMRKSTFKIIMNPEEKLDFLLKVSNGGEPTNISGYLMNEHGYSQWVIGNSMITAFTFGVLMVIFIFNLSYYLITKEKIYFYFISQVIFSALSLLYFEGFIHKYIFDHSSYWAKQSIGIFLCFTFIFNNLFLDEIFKFKLLSEKVYKLNVFLIYATLCVLSISFIHPLGFLFFINFSIAITSVIAFLMLFGIYSIRKNKNMFYVFVSIAIVSIVFLGTMYQLYLAGILPENYFTQYSMQLAIIFQSVFLLLAVNNRVREVREENDLYRIQLLEMMNQYSQNLITNIESERQKLASEIHDGFGQNLLVIRNKILQTLKKKVDVKNIEATLESLLDVTTDALDDARAMSHNLRPPILNTMGLSIAISSLVEKVKLSTDMDICLNMPESIDGLIDKDQEINIYRILQENFTNTLKHAHASTINLEVLREDKEISICFRDDGIGFDKNTALTGLGLLGIKERVSLLKGKMKLETENQKGTEILIKIPII